MGNWVGSLFKDEALGLTWDLAPEETRSYLGTFGSTRDSCSVYPCETQSQWGRRAVWGGRFRRGQTSGPLRPATVKLHTFCFLPKTYLQSQIQNQKIRGHTEHSAPQWGGAKEGDASSSTTPHPHPRKSEILHSYPGCSGNPARAEEESDSVLARAGSFK